MCPQNAVESDPATGIVDQMPQRCLGCRYCMTACPYHARYFNWWDPVWPAGMEKALNPEVAPRMRGVVEKCNFCHGRYHAAKRRPPPPANARSIPPITCRPVLRRARLKAITFGDLDDPGADVTRQAAAPEAFQMLAKLEHGLEDLLPLGASVGAAHRRGPLVQIGKGERHG